MESPHSDSMEVTTDLITLAFEYHPIRCLALGSHPELVAADVCAAVKLADFPSVIARLAPDEKVTRTAVVLGGRQKLVTVNEAGLDKLLRQSDKTIAKRFKRWLSREVLPAVKQTEINSAQTEINSAQTENDYTKKSQMAAASQEIQKLREKLELAELVAQENQKALLDANERLLWSERMNEFKSRQVSQQKKTIAELTKQLKKTQKELKQCQNFILQTAHVLGVKAMEIQCQGESDE